MKKKSNNIFIRLFSSIGRFFDKVLITPLTKLFFKFGEWINDGGRFFDKMSGNKSFLLIISLILAFSNFIVIDKENDVAIDQYAEILYQQPVTAIYNEELYVVEGLPEKVDITLLGQKRHIFLAKQSPSTGVSVDLTGYKPGQHKVRLKYSQRLKSLDYKLDPSEVTITIYKKVSTTKTLSYDILHSDNLSSKLYIDKVTLDRSEVIVKGSQKSLDKVASVKALVDAEKIPDNSTGEITLKDVPLVAYNANGKIMNVEIVPKTITCKVRVTSPRKEVPIKVIPSGTLALGKSIKSIDMSISKVTVYGKESAVDDLEQITVPIDVDGLSRDKTYNVTIEKPDGITELSTTQLTIKVTLSESSSKIIKNVKIITENLNDKYSVSALSAEDSTVDVQVTGSANAIKNVKVDNVKAFIDLSQAGPSKDPQNFKVQVTGDDVTLTYTVKTNKTISVLISEKK
jgi:YbbR domain-containing protein